MLLVKQLYKRPTIDFIVAEPSKYIFVRVKAGFHEQLSSCSANTLLRGIAVQESSMEAPMQDWLARLIVAVVVLASNSRCDVTFHQSSHRVWHQSISRS